METTKMYSYENPDDNAFCLPKDYEYNPDDYCQTYDWIDNETQKPTNADWKIIHCLLDQGTYYAIAKWENGEWVGQTPALEKYYDDEVIEWCPFKNLHY